MDELERDFLNEICHMRMEIAYKKLLETRTSDETERVKERDAAIDDLFERLANECSEVGIKILFEYVDEMVDRESDDADFFYRSGFEDGVQLIIMLQKIAMNL